MIPTSSEDVPSGHWYLNSDPPDEQYTATRMESALETPIRASAIASSANDSISEELISRRKSHHQDIFPSYSSSPTYSHQKQQQEQRQRLQTGRDSKRNKNALKMRGGIETMENFVMKSERQEEALRLQQQALDHAIPDELIEKMEQEQQEDLDDDELIDLIDQREHWECELNQILSELIID